MDCEGRSLLHACPTSFLTSAEDVSLLIDRLGAVRGPLLAIRARLLGMDLLCALASTFLLAAPSYSSDVHSQSQATEHFEVRYRPGSRAGASVDRIAHRLELEYAETLRKLGIAGKVDESAPFEVYLYDDVAELAEISGVKGNGGYASGREVHIPWDNDQTRQHELVHVVVAAMDPSGDEARNMFFAEGLANAVLGYVHGVPVHAVAAYERERGTLPALGELASHQDFYSYLKQNPGLNGYDIGGSYFLHLLENHRPLAVMDFYHGVSIEKALGQSLEETERSWHRHLESFPIRPELRVLLSRKRGDGGEFTSFARPSGVLPLDVLGGAESWTSVLADVVPSDAVGKWEIDQESVHGSNESGRDWTSVVVDTEPRGDCVLRMRATTGNACWGIKIQYGSSCEAMVLGGGAFIYTDRGGIAHTDSYKLRPNAEVDLVFRVQDNHVEMYVDGALLLEADLPLKDSPIGFGLVGGQATIHGFSVRDL